MKTVNRLEKFLASEDEFFGGLDRIEELGEDDAKELQKVVNRMKRKLDQISAKLQAGDDPEPE